MHEEDITHIERKDVSDLTQYLRDNIDQFDCVLVYDRDEVFEEALSAALADRDKAVSVYYRKKR